MLYSFYCEQKSDVWSPHQWTVSSHAYTFSRRYLKTMSRKILREFSFLIALCVVTKCSRTAVTQGFQNCSRRLMQSALPLTLLSAPWVIYIDGHILLWLFTTSSILLWYGTLWLPFFIHVFSPPLLWILGFQPFDWSFFKSAHWTLSRTSACFELFPCPSTHNKIAQRRSLHTALHYF